MRSRRIRPVSWSTSYLLRSPLGISTRTSNSSTSSSTIVVCHAWARTQPGGPGSGHEDQSRAQCPGTRSREGELVGRRDRRHAGRASGGRLLRWVPVVLVLSLLAAAGAAYRYDLGARWFGTGDPDPSQEPAAVAPPEGV